MFEFAWLIPVFPLITYALITLVPPIRQSRQLSYTIAIAMMVLATALAWGVLFQGATSANGFGTPEPGHAATAAGHEGETGGEAEAHEGPGAHFAGFSSFYRNSFRWAPTGEGAFEMGYRLDPVVALMLAMVTLAALCIHIFSVGYMAHDEFPAGHQRQSRFFSFISLFTAAMLTMVLADNLLLFFMAWEVMGLCSFLLIGFWYFKPSAREAAKKAFITTRIGDVGFLLGIAYLYNQAGSLTFGTAEGQIFNPEFLSRIGNTQTALGISVATGIALLLFMGTVGKSAQFPLHVWLPDAMEGPTPVSALIHAATMVAAGVFLVARTYPIFVASGDALTVVAGIGAFTALFAALIAVGQYDIKRILAYSTLSQLGFMVAALGVGGWLAGMFHLLTHAFFKALLFLGSGSVIHGMEAAVGHDPVKAQDIRNMGNIKKFMPTTHLTYLIGYLALAGFPLFSGFWSKDEILLDAFHENIIVYIMLTLAAFLTAFYMTRQMAVVFWGSNFRGNNPRPTNPAVEHSEDEIHGHDHGAHQLGQADLDAGHAATAHGAVDAHRHHAAHDAHDAHGHHDAHDAHGAHGAGVPHESPSSMLIPLIILAIFAFAGGFVNTPFGHWLANFTGQPSVDPDYMVMGIAIAMALAGMFLGWITYRNAFRTSQDTDPLARTLGGIYGALERKFAFDELYQATIIRLNYILGRAFRWLDDKVVDRIVNVTGLGTFLLGRVNFIIDDFSLNTSTDTLAEGTVVVGDGVRQAQTGKIQDYGALIFAGAVVIAIIYVYAL